MKTLSQRIQEMNFRKAFIVFFSALLVFGISLAAYMAITDQWGRASESPQTGIAGEERGGGRRAGFSHGRGSHRHDIVINITSDSVAISEAAEMMVQSRASNAGFRGNHLGFRDGTTMTGLGVFFLIGVTLHLLFRLLLAGWAFADSQKHGKNRALWPILALITGVFGFVIYLISREHKGRVSANPA